MTLHSRHLRNCFGCFATGVTVATALLADGNLAGVTVNSFSSVSLEPALLLFSLDNNSSSIKAFMTCERFALNILSEQQRPLSERFALPRENKWEGVEFTPGPETGAPVIAGVIAYLECIKEHIYEGGDHSIFVGRVLGCNVLSEGNPLVYYKGMYRGIGASL